MSISLRRAALPAAALTLTAAVVLGTALPASAHVHVDPNGAKAGATDVALSFAVPNESATATTTKVQITLPEGLGAVTAQKITGWRVALKGSDDAPNAVVFTAGGDGIGDGQTQQFVLTVATVPDTGSIVLPVAQTYSDGTVVDWDEPTPASGEEPEHPAPTVYVNDAAPAAHDDDDATEASGHDDGAAHEDADAHAAADDGSGTAALVLSGTALGVAVLGAVLAAFALLRTRRGGRP